MKNLIDRGYFGSMEHCHHSTQHSHAVAIPLMQRCKRAEAYQITNSIHHLMENFVRQLINRFVKMGIPVKVAIIFDNQLKLEHASLHEVYDKENEVLLHIAMETARKVPCQIKIKPLRLFDGHLEINEIPKSAHTPRHRGV